MCGWEEEETRERGSVEEFTLAWGPFTKSRLITKDRSVPFHTFQGPNGAHFSVLKTIMKECDGPNGALMASIKTQACLNMTI